MILIGPSIRVFSWDIGTMYITRLWTVKWFSKEQKKESEEEKIGGTSTPSKVI